MIFKESREITSLHSFIFSGNERIKTCVGR